MNDGCKTRATKKHVTTDTHNEYRKVFTTANKIETIQNKLESVIDLFATPIVSNLFTKICNDCAHLLIKCDFKLEDFRKAEELVWRRAYHDVYRLIKTKRQLIRKQDEFLIESHFVSGIGYYSSLIVQLRIRYKIAEQAHGIIYPLNLALAPVEGMLDGTWLGDDARANVSDKSVSLSENAETGTDDKAAHHWARQAIYRSLVYMGDLARYLLEFSDFDHRKLAFELYRSASRYQPEQGLPFNQLATLSGNMNYNLDAICNYMRCCLRPKPFERAEGNMVKLFEMNQKHYDELARDSHVTTAAEVLASIDPGKEAENLMKLAIVTFLKLASDLWLAIGENLTRDLQDTIVHETQKFFEILREAMELEPIVPLSCRSSLDTDFRPISGNANNLDRPRYVSPTIIYEFCSISIMLIARRQQKAAASEMQTLKVITLSDNIPDLVNTLALNLLHYATSKCQRMVISKIQDLRLSRQSNDYSSPISSDGRATGRREISRLRQRKAATTYRGELANQNRPNCSHDLDDSELSELEETALSTIDALEISSDMSEGPDYKTDDLIILDSSSDDGATNIKTSRPLIRPTRSQTYEKNNYVAHGSCSSLPPPDLLTGDLADTSFRTNPSIYCDVSETPSEFGSELQLGPSIIESTLSYIYNQTYLPTIKVLFDWLLSNGMIIDANIESFTSYRVELFKIVELLDELKLLIEMGDGSSEIFEHVFCGPEWTQNYPLSCDFAFVNLEPMKNVHESNIDFRFERDLDDCEGGFITIQCITAFSHALSVFLENKTKRM